MWAVSFSVSSKISMSKNGLVTDHFNTILDQVMPNEGNFFSFCVNTLIQKTGLKMYKSLDVTHLYLI